MKLMIKSQNTISEYELDIISASAYDMTVSAKCNLIRENVMDENVQIEVFDHLDLPLDVKVLSVKNVGLSRHSEVRPYSEIEITSFKR